MIDELPEQFQYRDFKINKRLLSNESQKIKYTVRPVSRGEFHFGNTIALVCSQIGFVKRKFTFENTQMLASYPSFLKLRQYELLAISNNLIDAGKTKHALSKNRRVEIEITVDESKVPKK